MLSDLLESVRAEPASGPRCPGGWTRPLLLLGLTNPATGQQYSDQVLMPAGVSAGSPMVPPRDQPITLLSPPWGRCHSTGSSRALTRAQEPVGQEEVLT